MDSMVKIYLNRALNELSQAKLLFTISGNNKKKEEFQIEEEMTFYSGVISHAYYSIFYSSKALLLTKGIKTTAPEVHKKTYELFKEHFVASGIIDVGF